MKITILNGTTKNPLETIGERAGICWGGDISDKDFLANEVWKPVYGYENMYEVSNIGNVRSLNFRNIKGKVKILKPLDNGRGYLQVRLSKKWYKVHRLVAEAFLPNPQNYKEINHKDENKNNNKVDNLEWCSRKYNINYGNRNLRQSLANLGRSCPTKKKVVCLETGQVFNSAKEAYTFIGVCKDYFLKKVIKYGYKAHGFTFKYLEMRGDKI